SLPGYSAPTLLLTVERTIFITRKRGVGLRLIRCHMPKPRNRPAPIEPELIENLPVKTHRTALSSRDTASRIVIKNDQGYVEAGEFLLTVKGLLKEVEDTFEPIIKAAHKAHKEAVAQKRKFSDPLEEAERLVKAKIGMWVEQQRLAAQREEERLKRE